MLPRVPHVDRWSSWLLALAARRGANEVGPAGSGRRLLPAQVPRWLVGRLWLASGMGERRSHRERCSQPGPGSAGQPPRRNNPDGSDHRKVGPSSKPGYVTAMPRSGDIDHKR
jgi:hypothetical protein